MRRISAEVLGAAIVVAAIGGLETAMADDIGVAVKPATTQQHVQLNHTHLDNGLDKDVVSYTSKLFLGATNGVWAYATARGINKETPTGDKNGVGDSSIGGGGMLKYRDIDELFSAGITVPTAEEDFGNNRTDADVTSRTTYRKGSYQANLTLRRTFTGENDNGVNPPDATYAGFVAAKKVSDNLLLGAGPIIDMLDDGTRVFSIKGAFRLWLSEHWFVQVGATQVVDSHKGSESQKMAVPETGIEIQLRYCGDRD